MNIVFSINIYDRSKNIYTNAYTKIVYIYIYRETVGFARGKSDKSCCIHGVDITCRGLEELQQRGGVILDRSEELRWQLPSFTPR